MVKRYSFLITKGADNTIAHETYPSDTGSWVTYDDYEADTKRLSELLGAAQCGELSSALQVIELKKDVERLQREIDRLKALQPCTDYALNDLADEMARARAKFPGNALLMSALAEEVGELASEVLTQGPRHRISSEALQVACVAMRIYQEGLTNHISQPRTILGMMADLEPQARRDLASQETPPSITGAHPSLAQAAADELAKRFPAPTDYPLTGQDPQAAFLAPKHKASDAPSALQEDKPWQWFIDTLERKLDKDLILTTYGIECVDGELILSLTITNALNRARRRFIVYLKDTLDIDAAIAAVLYECRDMLHAPTTLPKPE